MTIYGEGGGDEQEIGRRPTCGADPGNERGGGVGARVLGAVLGPGGKGNACEGQGRAEPR